MWLIHRRKAFRFTVMDYMEYASNAAAQDAYVTSATTGTIVDENGTHTITAVGNVAVTTDQSCAYNGSLGSIYFDGTGDYASIPDSDDWSMGSGDFTFDTFISLKSLSSFVLFTQGNVTDAPTWGYSISIRCDATTISLQYSLNGTTFIVLSSNWSPVANTFYHVAFVRYGDVLYIFVDGLIIGTHAISGTLYSSAYSVHIAAGTSSGSWVSVGQGYLDNYRITKGTALWTSNFNLTDEELRYTGTGANFGNLFIAAEPSFKSLSEPTIKTQGAYSLRLSATTDALNETVTKTLTGGDIIDLSGQNTIKFDARGGATGGNLEVGLHQEGDFASNADFVDEDCSSLTGWTDGDTYTGVSTQVTFDGQETFKLDAGVSTSLPQASRHKDFGSTEALGNRIVVEIKIYCDAIGPGWNDHFVYHSYRSDLDFLFAVADDAVFIANSISSTEVCTGLVVQDTWQTWTCDIDLSAGVANAVCDVYLDGDLKASDVSCNKTGSYTDGLVSVIQLGHTTDNRITYVDYIKIGTDFHKENHTINIATSDTWQEEPWDISGIADADKNAIDQIEFKVLDASSAQDFYIDNMKIWKEG